MNANFQAAHDARPDWTGPVKVSGAVVDGHPYAVIAVYGDGVAFIIGRNHHLPHRFEAYAVPVAIEDRGRPYPWDGWKVKDAV